MVGQATRIRRMTEQARIDMSDRMNYAHKKSTYDELVGDGR